MTPNDLKNLLDAATPGPWICAWGATRQPIAIAYSTSGGTDGKEFGLYGATWVPIRVDEDMQLCATSRNILPLLLKLWEASEAASGVMVYDGYEAEINELREALDALREMKGH